VLILSDSPELATEQLRAILSYLVALAHVDGEYAPAERDFVQAKLERLISRYIHTHHPYLSEAEREHAIAEQVRLFQGIAQHITDEIAVLCDEAVVAQEGMAAHVADKLRLRCAEVLASFDADARQALLAMCDELILADGVQHPSEVALHKDIEALLQDAGAITLPRPLPPLELELLPMAPLAPKRRDLDFFAALEQPYPDGAGRPFKRALGQDRERVRAAIALLEKRRRPGQLAGKRDLGELDPLGDFTDGWVQHLSTRAPLELTVLGDLHGCYGCMKAAILQADFLGKLAAWRADPVGKPRPVLLCVGDYVDRGRYSFEGVLRTALELFLDAPDHVVLLRGNHEHYKLERGRVLGVVTPAEAIELTGSRFPEVALQEYKRLFELLPSVCLAGRTIFVHGGIPRDATLARHADLTALNDPQVRFEMSWSDPSTAASIPQELQARSSRFAFGRRQFLRFMATIGASLMVRGHETVEDGMRVVYAGEPAQLINLFTAGGAWNDDLPASSPYRRLAPAAMLMTMEGARVRVAPYPVAYEPYVVPGGNRFYSQ
jgi:hypothetical protein